MKLMALFRVDSGSMIAVMEQEKADQVGQARYMIVCYLGSGIDKVQTLIALQIKL